MTNSTETITAGLTDEQKTAAVQAAADELIRRALDPGHYRHYVVKNNDVIVVVFSDKDVPEGARGVEGKHPGIEVEINAEDMQVIRSYFVR